MPSKISFAVGNAYLRVMPGSLADLPLYAVQRVAGRWLIRAPDADPQTPAVRVVAALDVRE